MAAVTSAVDFFAGCNGSTGEKPYSLRYEPSKDFPRTNFASEARHIAIEDVRGRENEFALDRQGFALLRIEPSMEYDDFDDNDKVQTIYFKQVAEGIRKMLGASRVQIFEHVVSNTLSVYHSHCCSYCRP